MAKIYTYESLDDAPNYGKKLSTFIKGKEYSLPPPYNKKIEGVTEAQILKRVKDCLDYLKIFYKRIDSQGKFHATAGCMLPSANVGIADIIAIGPGGLFLAIELKKPGGKISSEQWNFLHDVAKAGGVAIVCVSEKELYYFLKDGKKMPKLGEIFIC
jgi:hypothetical protein